MKSQRTGVLGVVTAILMAMGIDYVAVTVALASFDFPSLGADNSRQISEQAAKLNQRGIDYLHRKQYDQAIAIFREALQIQPEYADALDNLGKALEAADKGGEAIAQFDKAISIAPEKAAAYADKGQALFHAGKYEEAVASYRQAIEHHANFSEAQNGGIPHLDSCTRRSRRWPGRTGFRA